MLCGDKLTVRVELEGTSRLSLQNIEETAILCLQFGALIDALQALAEAVEAAAAFPSVAVCRLKACVRWRCGLCDVFRLLIV